FLPIMRQNVVILLLLALISTAFAYKCAIISNNDGKKSEKLCVHDADRQCFCVANVQTYKIKGVNGGDIKLFWSRDCTGNFKKLDSNSETVKAHWVNSISLGKSGIPSYYDGTCPNWYS
ncbi:hypothetical protein BGW42_007356, partial [Actinomortierella wolfii]